MKTATPVRYDEIEGKTVAGAGFGCTKMLIAFTDGTVLALSVDEGCEGPEIDFEQGRDIELRFWDHEAFEAGILSREELADIESQRKSQRIARLESEIASLKGGPRFCGGAGF